MHSGPQAPRGQGPGAERVREGPGKATQTALQWARPPEEPVRLSLQAAGLSPCAVPRCSACLGRAELLAAAREFVRGSGLGTRTSAAAPGGP